MSGKMVLILGGGLGGLTAAGFLRRLLPPEHRVVLLEKKETFSLCMSNLWLMTGEREAPGEGERPMARLADRGIEWVRADIETIDAAAKAVQTSAGSFGSDYLVLALGAEKDPQAVPGFSEAALNLYEVDGSLQIRRALEGFAGGRIVVLVARTPFSCPSAPYEAAFLIDSVLRERGVRERSEIAVYSPEEYPMPVAGSAVGRGMVKMLEDRQIEFHGEQIVMKVDPAAQKLLFELEDTSFDLLVGVPPHRAPAAVRQSGLTDASGWVPVDQTSLQTRHPGVSAIGDVTAIRLANGMFLPKAGVFADGQARAVAATIAADIAGEARGGQFNGYGFCYIEVGQGMAAAGSGNFYSIPAPSVTLESPSPRFRQDKEGLERAAFALWE